MGKVEGGMKCVKYLLFVFNFIFWVSVYRMFAGLRDERDESWASAIEQNSNYSPKASDSLFADALFAFSKLNASWSCSCSVQRWKSDGLSCFSFGLPGTNQIFHRVKEKKPPSFSRLFERKAEWKTRMRGRDWERAWKTICLPSAPRCFINKLRKVPWWSDCETAALPLFSVVFFFLEPAAVRLSGGGPT